VHCDVEAVDVLAAHSKSSSEERVYFTRKATGSKTIFKS
jgi:hypothetical protein